MLVEVPARGRGHAIGLMAEENLIQVEGEDLVLAVARFQAARQYRLPNLALECLLGGAQEGSRNLLGYGGAALHDVPRAHIREQGAQHAPIVEATVLVESAVFYGHESLQELSRESLQGQNLAVLGGQIGQLGAIPGPQARGFGSLQAVAVEVGQGGQGAGEVRVEANDRERA